MFSLATEKMMRERGAILAARAKIIIKEKIDARSDLALRTVQRTTLQQYESACSLLRAFCMELGLLTEDDSRVVAEVVDEDLFDVFLLATVHEEMKVPAALRTALRKQQQVLNLPMWAEHDRAKTSFKGARYNGGTKPETRKRGTLNLAMYKQLIGFTKMKNPHLISGITCQWGCALRISQMVGLLSGQVKDHPPRICVTDKRETADTLDSFDKNDTLGDGWREVWDHTAFRILLLLQSITPEGELLFPRANWTIREYNKNIQECAKENKWPASMKFDGSHTLRHGGVGVAVTVGITPKQLQMSLRMVKHYSTSLEARVNKAKKKELKQVAKKK